jgi:hypothetical protein
MSNIFLYVVQYIFIKIYENDIFFWIFNIIN